MNKSYLSSVSTIIVSSKPSTAVRLLLMVLFVSLFGNIESANAATITSKTTGGNWSLASTWIGGVVPNSSDDVVIASGATVILNTNVSANKVTVDGMLSMNFKVDVTLNTQLVVVTSSGRISFDHTTLTLPSGAALYLQNGSNSLIGSCNNNDELDIGGVHYAVCTGGGALYSFAEVENAGGANVATAGAIGTAQTICNGATPATLISTTDGAGSGAITYEWQTNASGSYVTISGASGKTYSPPALTATTSYRRRTVAVIQGSTFYSISYTNPVTITVNPVLGVPGTITGTATVCQGQTNVGYLVPVITNATSYFWAYSGTGATISSGVTNAPSVTFAANSTSGNLTVYGVDACGNQTAVANYTITVQAAVSTPTVGTITQPDCVTSTGSVVLSGLPASGTIYQTGTVTASYPITGTTMTISGLTAGTYNLSVSNGSCSSSATGNVVMNSVVTNTWTTSWDKGTPNSSQKLVFTGNYPPATDPNVDINGCSCMVTGGVEVTIKSGRTLTITNDLAVVGGGTLTFENNASLVQINDVANTGNIIYKRITPSLIETDYAYWSSPVAGQTLNISPDYAYGTFYSYDYSIDNWASESLSTNMAVGNGYIIRGQKSDNTAYNIMGTFVGIPNNGTKTIAIGSTGTSNLLGNPYPSAINADTFLAANSSIVDGTIYLWTHNTAIQLASGIINGTAGSGLYAYTSDDYASYNITGGVGVGNFANGVEKTTNRPTGKIAAGQAFFTTSKTTGGAVTFNNDMRVSGNNTQFFKTKNPKVKTTNDIEKHRVWLNMTNTKGAFKQTLVGYVTDATNDYDSRFDGESFDANEYVDFYSINEDKNLVIQGRALPFDEKDEVPLGFRSAIDGAFTINIDEVDGLLVNQSVFLEDKLTNTVTDLKNGSYTFNTTAGTFNDRFVLRYTSNTLGTGDFDAVINQVVVSVKNKLIKINSFANTIDKVLIYDMSGRLICQKDKVNNSELLLTDIVSSHQTLIVKTSLQNGNIVTDKIIY